MRTRSLIIIATLIAALVLALAVIALAQNPNIGTWKMNPAKSKFNDPLALKSYTMTIEPQEGGFKIVQDSVDSNGTVYHRSWAAKYDGTDFPVTGKWNHDGDIYSSTRTNPSTTDYVFKKNGKEVYRGQVIVSQDGRTRTDTGGGKDAKGQAFTYTIFLEKQ
jgi:hypothetical protein